MTKWFYGWILLLVSSGVIGQDLLKLEDAIAIALEQNFDIQIARLEVDAQVLQEFKANAGIGPTVNWVGNFSITGNNVNQKFIDDRVVSRYGRAFNPNTSVQLGLTLYDGGRMQANFERLGMLSELSELESKVVVQNTIVEVMQSYYEILRQKEALAFLNTIIKYYEERLKITEERWNVGQGSKLDYLQSKSDLNAQLSLLVAAKNNLKNTKVVLNGLLNRDPSVDFVTEDLETVDAEYQLDGLIDLALNKNRDIIQLQKAVEISMKGEEEAEASRRVQLDANAALGYSYLNTNAGFLLSNRNISLNAGVSAFWNIYDGNLRKRQIELARINTEIIHKQKESLQTEIITDLNIAHNQYVSDLELLKFEEENQLVAEENLSISLEKFRLGGSTILELNEAQRTYDTALNRLVNAQYNTRISQLDLLQLSGSLVD